MRATAIVVGVAAAVVATSALLSSRGWGSAEATLGAAAIATAWSRPAGNRTFAGFRASVTHCIGSAEHRLV